MDGLSLITAAAGVAAILALFYIAVFGSRSLGEWWQQRRISHVSKNTQPRTTLHNLPRAAHIEFIDRKTERDKLSNLLSSESRHFLICIEGFAGIGKTALAQVVSERLLSLPLSNPDRFEAVIWSSAKRQMLTSEGLRVRDRTLTLEDLLTTIAIVLKRDDITRARREEQLEAVRFALTEMRTLLIVDSQEANDDQSVLDFLREVPSPTKVLITSRRQLPASFSLRLSPFDIENAELLCKAECLEKEVVLEPLLQKLLLKYTAGIPMAIVWSIAQISSGMPAETVVGHLANLPPEDDLIRFCFSGIAESLRDTPVHDLLLALSLFVGTATVEALRHVSGTTLDEAGFEQCLLRLARLSLVTRSGQYLTVIGLTRAFAAIELDKTTAGSLFRKRFVDYYIAASTKTDDSAGAEIASDLDNVEQAIDLALSLRASGAALQIVINISRILYVKGLYAHIIRVWEAVKDLELLDHDSELRIRAAKVFAYGPLYAYLRNGRGPVALAFLQKALGPLEGAGDTQGLALVYQRLGIITRELRPEGTLAMAKEFLNRAADCAAHLPTVTQDDARTQKRLLADINNGLGAVALLERDIEKAVSLLGQADHLFQDLGDTSTRSSVVRHLAEAQRNQAHLSEARILCNRAIELAVSSDRKDRLADAFYEMAKIESAYGRPQKARDWSKRAVECYLAMGAFSSARRADTEFTLPPSIMARELTRIRKLFRL